MKKGAFYLLFRESMVYFTGVKKMIGGTAAAVCFIWLRIFTTF